jgi:hypothetical protein
VVGVATGLAVGVAMLAGPGVVYGQAGQSGGGGGAADAAQTSPKQLLEDFIHYVYINNIEMAQANANALLALNLTPERFLGIVEDSATLQQRFDEAYRRALRRPELEGLAAQLHSLYEDGRRQRARNPDEIARNIDLLGGNLSEQIFAEQMLKEAKEYAVPQLLDEVLRGTSVTARANARGALQTMGHPAAVVLDEAMLFLDANAQVIVAQMLGVIGDPVSVPYLYEVHNKTPSQPVREATEDAIRRISGQFDPTLSVAGLYRNLAERYFADRERGAMQSFPGEAYQVVWSYMPAVGLTPTAILTDLFNEMMAMRLAEHSLRLDPSDTATLSLWLAANFAREISQPAGYDNPLYPNTLREPMYYAVAAGTGPSMRVLSRAMRERETVLARRAIEAISRCTGGAALFGGAGGERPLVQALSYPDRRVQYEAALAIGGAFPTQVFTGADQVTPILAGLIGDASNRYAVVVASDVRQQQDLRAVLEGMGYTVLAPAANLRGAAEAIARAPVVDLIVTEVGGRTMETIEEIRRTPRLEAAPVLALMPWADVTANRTRMADDHLTRLAREGLKPEEIETSVDQLVERASGEPVSAADARRYAMESLDVLRSLAIGGNEVLSVRDAASALITALGETKGDVRLRVAEVMSHIGSRRVQVALMDAALSSKGDERIALLDSVANSAKRFGDMLEPVQVKRLIELAQTGDGETATAAAALMGALSLSNDRLVPLILSSGESE